MITKIMLLLEIIRMQKVRRQKRSVLVHMRKVGVILQLAIVRIQKVSTIQHREVRLMLKAIIQ
jgi:hypothetical protein